MRKFKCHNLIEQKLSDDRSNLEITGLIDYELGNAFFRLVKLMNKEEIEAFATLEDCIYKRNNIEL